MLYAVRKPDIAPADTPITNSGITVNAQNPSDDIHEVSGGVDSSNKQISSQHPSTTADFVIFLNGISNDDGDNFTAPITASWRTQPGSFTSFSSESGTVSFPNKYDLHYQFVKIPVTYNSSLYSESYGSYESFYLNITGATNASIGNATATELVVKGAGSPNVP